VTIEIGPLLARGQAAAESSDEAGQGYSDSRPSGGRVPGEAGIWVLLTADVLMFMVLFAVYLYARGLHPEEFTKAQDTVNTTFGATNTLVLLSSSLLVVYAGRWLRRTGDRTNSGRLMLAGACVGALFVVIKSVEYLEMTSAGITANTNDFYMLYFTITGLHLSHVVIGLGILIALAVNIRRSRSAPTRVHTTFFEAGSLFWHTVDLLWIAIYALVYLVR
jgi:nitric oxide reductase NorE protein